MNLGLWLIAVLALLPTAQPGQYPCKAVHYGRVGHMDEISMPEVVANRLRPGGDNYIPGFSLRADVQDFIAVRYADRWRIAQNWRALVIFRLPASGTWTRPVWLQPADYQAPWDVTSSSCRVETSAELAKSQGWSLYQGWGTTTARILEWQR